MKKFCLLWSAAVLLLVVASAMAEDDYGIGMGDDGGWKMTTGANGSSTSFTALKDSSLTLTVEGNLTGGFTYGTFQYTQTGHSYNIVEDSMQTLGTVGSGETGQSGTSSVYSSGDMVGVWVQSEGMTLYSLDSLNPASLPPWGTYTDAQMVNGVPTVRFNDTRWLFDQIVPDIEITVAGGAPVTPAASGSPLPGVWGTMVLAGAVGGYIKRRKNRS